MKGFLYHAQFFKTEIQPPTSKRTKICVKMSTYIQMKCAHNSLLQLVQAVINPFPSLPLNEWFP